MEDRSSFPGCGSGEADDLMVGRSEEVLKCLSSRCPCKLRSTQLQSAQARMLSLTGVPEEAASTPHPSVATERALDTFSEETSCLAVALSSAVGSESFSSQFDFCSSIPRTEFDLLDRDLTYMILSPHASVKSKEPQRVPESCWSLHFLRRTTAAASRLTAGGVGEVHRAASGANRLLAPTLTWRRL